MNLLTTITPAWGRWDAFDVWAKNLEAAHTLGVSHLVFFPDAFAARPEPREHFEFVNEGRAGDSIGWFHNRGAELAESEWIMKLDLDAIVNPFYFRELVKILALAKDREWFNGGMLFIQPGISVQYLCSLLSGESYRYLLDNRKLVAGFDGEIGGSNFICRRKDYLACGGCDSRFCGWGWEDYQQTFALEAQFRRAFPLPRTPSYDEVTRICRDWITKPKARALLLQSPWLCLLHRWHPQASRSNAEANKHVLYDYISNYEKQFQYRPGLSSQAKEGRIFG